MARRSNETRGGELERPMQPLGVDVVFCRPRTSSRYGVAGSSPTNATMPHACIHRLIGSAWPSQLSSSDSAARKASRPPADRRRRAQPGRGKDEEAEEVCGVDGMGVACVLVYPDAACALAVRAAAAGGVGAPACRLTWATRIVVGAGRATAACRRATARHVCRMPINMLLAAGVGWGGLVTTTPLHTWADEGNEKSSTFESNHHGRHSETRERPGHARWTADSTPTDDRARWEQLGD